MVKVGGPTVNQRVPLGSRGRLVRAQQAEPYLVAGLSDPDVLAREHAAEADLAPIEAQPAAG